MTQEEFFTRYSIDFDNGWLGEGSFGTVYKAYDNYLNIWKAVKIAKVRIIDGKQFSLVSEFQAIKSLPLHPNIAYYENVYQFQMSNGLFDYAVMQYYKDGNLKQFLQSRTLDYESKRQVVEGLLQGVIFLHENNIIHRDIKPGNVMIAIHPQGMIIPKITDFGLSRIKDGDISFMTGSIGGGTLEYSSPEQLYGKPISFNTDLWSFGVIVFEVMTGMKPFYDDMSGNTEAQRLKLYQNITTGNISEKINTIPTPYKEIIELCLEADVRKRVDKGNILLNYLRKYDKVGATTGDMDEETYVMTKAEREEYEHIRDSHDINDLRMFVGKFPNSIFYGEISARISSIQGNKHNGNQHPQSGLHKSTDKREHSKDTLTPHQSNSMAHISLKDRINRLLARYRRYSYRDFRTPNTKFLYLIPILFFSFIVGYWAYSHFSKVEIYSEKGKYGLQSQLKGIIYEAVFDTIIPLENGHFRVIQFNKTFIVDGMGNSQVDDTK